MKIEKLSANKYRAYLSDGNKVEFEVKETEIIPKTVLNGKITVPKWLVEKGRFPFPRATLDGRIIIPPWVFDRFKGEKRKKLEHVLLHEKKHLDDNQLDHYGGLLFLGIIGFAVQSMFNNLGITFVAALISLLPWHWFFENRCDRHAAIYAGKKAYAETLKEFEKAKELGAWILFEKLLHPLFRERWL